MKAYCDRFNRIQKIDHSMDMYQRILGSSENALKVVIQKLQIMEKRLFGFYYFMSDSIQVVAAATIQRERLKETSHWTHLQLIAASSRDFTLSPQAI